MIDLAMIQKQGLLMAKRRGLAESPLSSFTHLTGEVQEAYLEYEAKDIKKLRLELADIVLVTASIAEEVGIDLESAIEDKHIMNLRRMP